MGVVSLIERLVKLALVLGALGTLGEAVCLLQREAYTTSLTGLISLSQINRQLTQAARPTR